MTGPASGAKVMNWIVKYIIYPIGALVIGQFLFFYGYGLYNFFV